MLISTQIKNVFSVRDRPCHGESIKVKTVSEFSPQAHLHEVLIEFRVHEGYVRRDVLVQHHREDRSHCVDSCVAERRMKYQ